MRFALLRIDVVQWTRLAYFARLVIGARLLEALAHTIVLTGPSIEPDAQRLLQRMRTAGAECFPGYGGDSCASPQLRHCRAFARTAVERLKRTCGIREETLERDFLVLFLFDMYDGVSFPEKETNILTARAEEFHRRAGKLTAEFLNTMREAIQIDDGYRRFLARTDISGGCLLLVDQNDLDELYRLLRPYLRGNLAMAGNVSPNLAIRLGQLLREESDFITFTTRAAEFSGCLLRCYEKGRGSDRLVVSCISGIGIAGKIAKIF